MDTTYTSIEGSRPPSNAQEAHRTSPNKRGLAAALVCFGVLKGLGFWAFMTLLQITGDYARKDPKYGGGHSPWAVLESWDGYWFESIAKNGYQPALVPAHIVQPYATLTLQPNSAAFFPLYPSMMRMVSHITGLGVFGAGMTISVLSSFAAAAGIYALTTRFGGNRAGVIAAAIWAVAPASGVEWAIYSDAMYIALAVWSSYCALTHRWLVAGALALAAGLDRPTAVALIEAIAIAAITAHIRDGGQFIRPLTAMLISPLGLIGYLWWVGSRTGSITGYFTLERGAWLHYFDFGQHTINVVSNLATGRFDYAFAQPFEDVIAVALLMALPGLLVAYLRLRPPLWLTAYTVVTIGAAVGSMQIFGNLARFLLAAFPLFIAPATAMRRVRWQALVAVFILLAITSGSYAGYAPFELGVP